MPNKVMLIYGRVNAKSTFELGRKFLKSYLSLKALIEYFT